MSEKLKNLLSDIVFENDFSRSSLQSLLQSCKQYQNFTNKDVTFINQINSNLSTNTNAEQNHQLLNTVIEQCSEEVLLSNAISWMSFSIKSSDIFSASIQTIDYINFYLIIVKSHHSNDVKKHFVTSILPKFILKLDKVPVNSSVCIAKLKALEKILKYYNGPCFTHYKAVERFLLQCIESWHSQDTILLHVALCYALLSQLGGGGHQTHMYRDNWMASLCKLAKYCHEVLDSVFEDIPEIQTVPIPNAVRTLEVSIPFPSYYPNTRDTSKLHASPHLARAFKVLSILMQTHLAAPFPAPKMINVEAVLSVVARTLSIIPAVLFNLDVTSGHAITLSLLPELHSHAHAMLNTLISVAGRNLITHSLYICKLTIHTLKWTNAEKASRYSIERPYRELRCACYETLHKWLSLAEYSSNIELMAEELVGYLLADIVYEKPPVTLTAVTKKTRKKHKTKVGLETEKRPLVDIGGNLAELKERSGDETSDVCTWAHTILVDLLKSAGMLLKSDLLKTIHTQIVGLLLPLSTGCSLPTYSTSVNARVSLYSTLEALLLYTHPMVPDVSHYATVFYHAGLSDAHVEVRSVCQRGIELLEKMHHPKADSLNFVMENLEEERLKLIGPLDNGKAAQMNGMNGDVSSDSDEEMEDEYKEKKGENSLERRSRKRTKIGKESDRIKRKYIDANDDRESKKFKSMIKKKSEVKNMELVVAKRNKKRKKKEVKLIEDSPTESDASNDVSGESSSEDSDDMEVKLMNMMGNGVEDDETFSGSNDDDDDDGSEDSNDSSIYIDDLDPGDFSAAFATILNGGGEPFQYGESDDDSSGSESDNTSSGSESDGVVITELVEKETKVDAEKKDEAIKKPLCGDNRKRDATGEKTMKRFDKTNVESKKDANEKVKRSDEGMNECLEKTDDTSDEASDDSETENVIDSKENEVEKVIEMIDLDDDSDYSEQTVTKTEQVELAKTDAVNEEITLSSDSQEDDVDEKKDKDVEEYIDVDDTRMKPLQSGDSKMEPLRDNIRTEPIQDDDSRKSPPQEVRLESKEDEEVAMEVDDCLKLFKLN